MPEIEVEHYLPISDLSHDPPLANALGNMVLAWAHAETRLICALARVTGIGKNMAQAGYYRIPTFEARVKFLSGLLLEWESEHYDKEAITKAVEKLGKLSAARNQWIHGDWCRDGRQSRHTITVIFNHRAPENSPERRKTVRATDVTNHCAAVIAKADELDMLIDSLSLPI